jgi:large-conductance mechanosensitive channel
VLLICAVVGSFGPPVLFLGVRQFHLEDQTSDWLVSMWPHSVALEDRRAAADMLVSYGELVATSAITFSVIGWSIFLLSRMFKRGRRGKGSMPSMDDSLHSG